MMQFYAVIQPYRDDFISRPVDEENKIMGQHFNYLKTLLKEGKLILAGPSLVEDDAIGIYILETETEEEARELMKNDPAIKSGIQEIKTFRPIRVSLLRGMELD